MRRYGGNFVSKLADAMVAADPDNFKILVEAFPQIVEKYTEADETLATRIRNKIAEISEDSIHQQILIGRAKVEYDRLSLKAAPSEKLLFDLKSKLYIVENNVRRDNVHFSGPDSNGGRWFNTMSDFLECLREIPEAERKPFAEWNGLIYAIPGLAQKDFVPTPGRIRHLGDCEP
jgi:hypothetical protein